VLDVNGSYNLVGGFDIAGLGTQQASEIDCTGTLWAVPNRSKSSLPIRRELGVLRMSIPWLTEAPESGALAASDTVDVTLTFDTTGLALGTYEATCAVWRTHLMRDPWSR
jgi:hypothetical protein